MSSYSMMVTIFVFEKEFNGEGISITFRIKIIKFQMINVFFSSFVI